MNHKSAYLLTYDNMVRNTKKWVDLGRLNSYYAYFSAFRFGEIIVAHRTNLPNTGIYMLTWNGNSLEDHGMQIDLGLIGGSSGIFIPKEDVKVDLFPLAILSDLDASYSTFKDGSKVAANIIAPSNDYTAGSKSAMVNGKFYIFGGSGDSKKVFLVYFF